MIGARARWTLASAALASAWTLVGACGGSAATPPSAPPASEPAERAPLASPGDADLVTLTVHGRRDCDCALWIDGVHHGPLVEGMEVRVTPGEHVLEARRGDAVVAATTISGRAGERGLALVMFEPMAAPAPDEPPPRRAPGHVEVPSTVRESGEGEFDPAIVIRTIGSRERALDDCYEIALGESPDVGGAVTLSMVVAQSGRVDPVVVLDGTIGETGDACVRRVIESIRFNPGPEGGSSTYELTLRFSPERS